jgi:pSer/pThr/pTyr-binding forkhead associated (FHA) protein
MSDLSHSIRSIKVDDMPRLIINGTVHDLVEDVVTIGRGPDNTIVISDASVSSHHAQLQRVGKNYQLKDLGSTNGTLVNGIRVTETTLRFDDRIRFGAIDARYEGDTIDSQPLPQIQKAEARPAELSAVPAGFTNASPFQSLRDSEDMLRTAILVGSAVTLLIFLGSMIAVLLMHAPPP